MREIKFRAWDNMQNKMYEVVSVDFEIDAWYKSENEHHHLANGRVEIMQYTGLKDKNGLQDIYECDILGIDGLVRGNMYENSQIYQERTDLIIPSITSKDWCEAHQTAMARGCRHTE